jgi:signal transduction histidine kinase
MFKKLRNRFLWYTMGLLMLVFAAMFVSIYISTENSARQQMSISLQIVVEKPYHKKKADNPLIAASISVRLNDETNDIEMISSLTEIDEGALATTVSEIVSTGGNKGFVTMDGTRFAYLYWPGIDHNNVAMVSSAQYDQTMQNLLFTFLVTGTGGLGLLFLLSWLFSEKAIKPVQQAFEKQKQFVADASHELKTPLTIIGTNMDLIKSNGSETVDSQHKWLTYIDDQTERMSFLVNDMLNLARLDDPSHTLALTTTNVSALIRRTLLYFEAPFYEKRIEVIPSIVENAQACADASALERLTSILLDNALKFTPRGGRMCVSLASEKTTLRLIISNTHDGLKQEQVDRLFDRFFRVSSSRSQQTVDYGLGLAIAKSVAEQHGGKINARLAGEWIEFAVELPIR